MTDLRKPPRWVNRALLRKLWPTRISDKLLAERLGHGRGAVRRCAQKLGLKPRRAIWNAEVPE